MVKPNRCKCGKLPEEAIHRQNAPYRTCGFIDIPHYHCITEGCTLNDGYTIYTAAQWNELVDGWVSCDVALPDDSYEPGYWVLVPDSLMKQQNGCFERTYNNAPYWVDIHANEIFPTHWRDLLELPKDSQ